MRGGGPGRAVGALAAALLALACVRALPPIPPDTLAPLLARTRAARGLAFTAPVHTRAIPPERVAARLARELDQGLLPGELERDARLKRVLGLLPRDTDLRRAILELQSGAVVGFYAPLEQALYLVGGPGGAGDRPSPQVEGVIVHELTHVLQGMHTPLIDVTLGLVDHDDLAFALGALLEGDATYTAFRDEVLRGRGVRPSAGEYAEEMALLGAEVARAGAPRWLRDTFVLQYPVGYAFVEGLTEPSGLAGLDAALADPPLSSEELLHPERYRGPRTPLALPELRPEALAPDPACASVAANTFGEIGLRVWASESGASPDEAADAADGWDGDRALLLDCPDGAVLAWLVRFDAPAEAGAFAALARSRPWPGTAESLATPPRVDRRRERVLLSAGLAPAARRALLGAPPPPRVRDLQAYLQVRPEVLERALRLRQAARR